MSTCSVCGVAGGCVHLDSPSPKELVTAADMYWIWSGEWLAWWRTNSQGYTCVQAEAGTYTQAEAQGILAGVSPGKKLKMVPVTPLPSHEAGRRDCRNDHPPIQWWAADYDECPLCKLAKQPWKTDVLDLMREVANLLAHETGYAGKPDGRTAEGRTITALGYALKKAQDSFPI